MKRKKDPKIFPDEIFMDAENIPGFETDRFEGRIEKPISGKTFVGVMAFFLFATFIFLGKIFSLQVINGEAFAIRSENNSFRVISILPNRGIIYDRNGEKLAWNGIESRDYTEMPGLSNLLGYVGMPTKEEMSREENISPEVLIGKAGIEKRNQDSLAGNPGLRLLETNSKNKTVSESVQRDPKDGEDISLSIDAKVQSQLFKIMDSVINERGFDGGAGIILDIKTGEVISLVSYPEYDSKILSAGEPRAKINEFIRDRRKPFLNRTLSGLYTPGSIIKPLVAVAALNEGTISPDKKIFSSGSISIPNPYYPDKRSIFYDNKAHGWVDMRRALAVSSNVYFYEVGGGFEDVTGLGIKRLEEYAKKFGWGSKTGIDLAGEAVGLVPTPKWKKENMKDSVWRIGDTYNASIGQGFFQVTPIQMAVYVTAIANNGKILKPHLKRDPEHSEQRPPVGAPEEYFKIVREGMRMAITDGTLGVLNIPSVNIAAKTGTAQVGLSKKHVNSWVIGFLPYEDPKIAFSIVLERGPAANLIGAARVARRLFDWMSVNEPEYLK